jgi:TonB family protein
MRNLNIFAAIFLVSVFAAAQSSSTVTIDLSQRDKSTLHPYQFRISSGVAQGLLLHRVEPKYSAELKNSGESGEVIVRFVIDKKGHTLGVIPHSNVDPRISKAVVEAIRRWRFKPYLLNGKPVEVETTVSVPYNFGAQMMTPSRIPPASQPPVKRLRISPEVARNSIVKTVAPSYPVEAKKKHLIGDVILGFVINKEGEVADLTLVRGDPILAQAALEAVEQWRYKPFLLNGQPVEVETTAKIIFRM